MAGVGARIRQERERRGWTQDELAEYSGVSLRTISKIENSEGEEAGAQERTLRKLQEALGVPILLRDMAEELEGLKQKENLNPMDFAVNCRAIVENAGNIKEKDLGVIRSSLEWTLDKLRGLAPPSGEEVPKEDLD